MLVKDGQVLNLYAYGEHAIALVKEYYSAKNTALDGYAATAPVDAYGPQNSFGFHNMVGNVWDQYSMGRSRRRPDRHGQEGRLVPVQCGDVQSIPELRPHDVHGGQRGVKRRLPMRVSVEVVA